MASVVKADSVALEVLKMLLGKVEVKEVSNLLVIFLTSSRNSLAKDNKAVVGREVAATLKLVKEEMW